MGDMCFEVLSHFTVSSMQEHQHKKLFIFETTYQIVVLCLNF